MRVKSLEIKKFRSINHCKINLDIINAIVGENNAGKTNILRALNAFFNLDEEEKYFSDETHRYKPRNNSYIIVTFENVPNNKVLNEYKDRNNNLEIEFVYEYNPKRYKYRIKVNGKKRNLPEDVIWEIQKYIKYVYIPAGRGSSDFDWHKNSIFTRLIEEYTNELISRRDNVSKSVEIASRKFHRQILSKIEEKLNKLYLVESNRHFKIDYSADVNYKIFMDLLRLNVVEYDKKLDIIEHGSGIGSLSIITIYRSLAQILDCNIYLGIEEPEANLHPQAQKKLINSLNNSREKNEIQTIFTTHSTVMIDELSHEQIILVRREKEKKRGFRSKITQLGKEFWNKKEVKNLKYSQFFKIRNSEFFFSKYVIIFESVVDAEIFEKILEKKTSKKLYDVSFFSLSGVQNLIYPVKLFDELDIPYSVVVDRDFLTYYKNNKKDESKDIDGFYMYQNRMNDFNKKVIQLMINNPSDLEKLNEMLEQNQSYSKLFNFLERYKLYSMKYCFEQDMMTSKKFIEICYDKFNLREEERKESFILKNKHKKIKDGVFLLSCIDMMEVRDYPYTINKIANSLINDIESTIG